VSITVEESEQYNNIISINPGEQREPLMTGKSYKKTILNLALIKNYVNI